MGVAILLGCWCVTIGAALASDSRAYVVAAMVTAVVHFVLAVGGWL